MEDDIGCTQMIVDGLHEFQCRGLPVVDGRWEMRDAFHTHELALDNRAKDVAQQISFRMGVDYPSEVQADDGQGDTVYEEVGGKA